MASAGTKVSASLFSVQGFHCGCGAAQHQRPDMIYRMSEIPSSRGRVGMIRMRCLTPGIFPEQYSYGSRGKRTNHRMGHAAFVRTRPENVCVVTRRMVTTGTSGLQSSPSHSSSTSPIPQYCCTYRTWYPCQPNLTHRRGSSIQRACFQVIKKSYVSSPHQLVGTTDNQAVFIGMQSLAASVHQATRLWLALSRGTLTPYEYHYVFSLRGYFKSTVGHSHCLATSCTYIQVSVFSISLHQYATPFQRDPQIRPSDVWCCRRTWSKARYQGSMPQP